MRQQSGGRRCDDPNADALVTERAGKAKDERTRRIPLGAWKRVSEKKYFQGLSPAGSGRALFVKLPAQLAHLGALAGNLLAEQSGCEEDAAKDEAGLNDGPNCADADTRQHKD